MQNNLNNNDNYYGYNPNKIEAEDAILFAKSCFNQMAEAVKKEISISQKERRLYK